MNRDTLKSIDMIYHDGYRINLEELLDSITETVKILLEKVVTLQERIDGLEAELSHMKHQASN